MGHMQISSGLESEDLSSRLSLTPARVMLGPWSIIFKLGDNENTQEGFRGIQRADNVETPGALRDSEALQSIRDSEALQSIRITLAMLLKTPSGWQSRNLRAS